MSSSKGDKRLANTAIHRRETVIVCLILTVNDCEIVVEALWDAFESAATTVASLYRQQGWRDFQQAAAASTQLYKAAIEAQRRAIENVRPLVRQQLLKVSVE